MYKTSKQLNFEILCIKNCEQFNFQTFLTDVNYEKKNWKTTIQTTFTRSNTDTSFVSTDTNDKIFIQKMTIIVYSVCNTKTKPQLTYLTIPARCNCHKMRRNNYFTYTHIKIKFPTINRGKQHKPHGPMGCKHLSLVIVTRQKSHLAFEDFPSGVQLIVDGVHHRYSQHVGIASHDFLGNHIGMEISGVEWTTMLNELACLMCGSDVRVCVCLSIHLNKLYNFLGFLYKNGIEIDSMAEVNWWSTCTEGPQVLFVPST